MIFLVYFFLWTFMLYWLHRFAHKSKIIRFYHFKHHSFINKNIKNGVANKLINSGFASSRFDLVEGDVIETSESYLKNKPGFRISLLNIDLDIEEPTYVGSIEIY